MRTGVRSGDRPVPAARPAADRPGAPVGTAQPMGLLRQRPGQRQRPERGVLGSDGLDNVDRGLYSLCRGCLHGGGPRYCAERRRWTDGRCWHGLGVPSGGDRRLREIIAHRADTTQDFGHLGLSFHFRLRAVHAAYPSRAFEELFCASPTPPVDSVDHDEFRRPLGRRERSRRIHEHARSAGGSRGSELGAARARTRGVGLAGRTRQRHQKRLP